MHRQAQYLNIWGVRKNLVCGFDAVQFGHRNIHDDHIWGDFPSQPNSSPPICRLTHNLHVRLLLNKGAQGFSHQSVIVGQQNLDAHKTSSFAAP